mmetsp:Transcript_32043/g.124774  ORF Transcript_32043/g.124774 Transcript_32043/m.124774 type:complete len:969 (-) Transcript_32043:297-3203(-)
MRHVLIVSSKRCLEFSDSVIVRLLRLSLGGVAMGIAFGLVALCFLAAVYEMFEVEVSMTIVVAFLGFWTAQSPSMLSGVICNVISGVMLSAYGKRLVSPLVRDPLQKIWELLSWLANTIVFVYAGLLVVAYIWSCAGDPLQWFDYVHILTWFAYLNLLRFVLVFLSHPIIRLGNKWYGFKEAAVVSYSGLRGAVTLILALEVGGTGELPSSVRSRVVVWSASIVALTLFVNGSTISTLLHWLGLDVPDPVKEDFLWRARAAMLECTYEILDREAVEEYTKYCSWSTVARTVVPEGWVQEFGKLKKALLAMHHKDRRSRTSLNRPSSSAMSRHWMDDVRTVPFVAMPKAVVGYVAQEIAPGHDSSSREAAQAPGDEGDDEGSQMATEEKENQLAGELEEEFAKIKINQQLGGTLDVEIRRRFLMSLLEAARERNSTSTSDFLLVTVVIEDIKYALDANEMGEVYNLFEFVAENPQKLPVPHWMDSVVTFFQRIQDWILFRMFAKSRYDRRILLATMVVEAVKHALDEPFLQESELVHKEARTLYTLTSAYLTSLEAAEPRVFARLQTKTIIQKVFVHQLEGLRQLRTEGKIDMEEHEVIKEELLQMQRQWYMRVSKSLPSGKRANENDAELLRKLPSFYHLESEVFETSVLENGRFATVENGAIVPSSDGDVVFVLRGGVEIRKSMSSIIGEMGATVGLDAPADLQVGFSSVPLHACISRYGVILPLDFFAHPQSEASQHFCCHVLGEATVFILPGDVARELAEQHLLLKEELARHMVRFVSYAIASATGPWNDSDGRDENGTPLEAGKALMQNVPYSSLVTLDGDETSVLLRGPALLISGRASVLRKSVHGYLLDKANGQQAEEYTAPAILPNGWITVEKLMPQSAEGPARVEIVVECSTSRDEVAANRIKRWNESGFLVDANGRFGFHSHVEVSEVLRQSEAGPAIDHSSDDGDSRSASAAQGPSDQ